jgi:predicted ArsR family transcriptional regulator
VSDRFGPGLGETRRALLRALKRAGPATLAQLVGALDLAPATLREHLQALEAQGLAERRGVRRSGGGRGRPEVIYAVSRAGDDLFPHQEGELLARLAEFLATDGDGGTLERFLARRNAARLPAALARVRDLERADRLAEVARILSEEGFMAESSVDPTALDRPALRLCHCPLRDLLPVSRLACEAEVAFVQALAGQPLERIGYIPAGDSACVYAPVYRPAAVPAEPPVR